MTVAGGHGQGAAANQLYNPYEVAVDASQNVYVADTFNHRVQRWAPGATSGVTVAGGNGQGPAANQLDYPGGVALDSAGDLYVLDSDNNRVQEWAPGATSGVTVAGGNGGGSGEDQFLDRTDWRSTPAGTCTWPTRAIIGCRSGRRVRPAA